MTGKSISLDGSSFLMHEFNTLFGTATVTAVVSFIVLLADTFIVGHFVGSTAVSAINIISPVISVSAFIGQLTTIGISQICERLTGEFNRDGANRVFGHGIIVASSVTLLMFIVISAFSDSYIEYMKLSDAVRTEVDNYWKYEKFVVLLYPINFLLTEIVFVDGDDLLCNISNTVRVLGNIFLSIILTGIMGTSGASLGSFIGTFLCTLILCIHFFRKTCSFHPVFSFSFSTLKKAFSISIVDAMPCLCWGLLDFYLNKLIIDYFSETYIPILSMITSILEITILFDGVGEAMGPLAEIYMGEKNYAGEIRVADYGLKIALVEGLLTFELMFILAPVLPPLYGVYDPSLSNEARAAIQIMSLSLPFDALLFFFTSQYKIVRHIKLASVITVFGQFITIILFSVTLSKSVGINGIWLSFVLGYAVTFITFGVIVFLRKGLRFPWLCPIDECPYLNCSFILSRENVITACKHFTELMNEYHVPYATQNLVNLVIEETGVLSFENNIAAECVAEYTVRIETDSVTVITRDTCRLLDIMQTKGTLENIQKFVVEKLMNSIDDKQYLASSSYNRSCYRIPYI